jgi:GT2 family glycosyltransferase
METTHRSSIQTSRSSPSLKRLERAGAWSAPFLKSVLPTVIRDALRALQGRILARLATRALPLHKEFDQSLEDALASAPLSIIVPVHDAPEVTRRCLVSLQKYAPKAEIILVNDASTLEETNKLLEEFSSRNSWKLIRQVRPLGHSAACAAGAGLATRPYLCLLNSDTVVTPWCWRPIVQVFENNPKIGVAGPSTSHGGELQTQPLAFAARHYLNDSQICEYARRLSAECSDIIFTELPCVHGFAFFIKRSLWEQLGGFDRNLPDYGNEIELCRRIVGMGYHVVWVRNSYVHHFGQASYRKAIGPRGILQRLRTAEDYIEQKTPQL